MTRAEMEQRLCALHGRRYCCLVGNGTAGLALCLQALGLRGRGVALPDSACLNVPLAVFYSDNRPVFVDIGLDDFGLALAEVEARAAEFAAVVAVHGYGSVARMAEMEALAARLGLPLIEDACLVQGGSAGARPAGSFGLASVLSFGAGKPISLGHGGAVLTDDPELYRAVRALDEKLPAFTQAAQDAIDELGSRHTRLYNAHYGSNLAEHIEPFRRAALAAGHHFLHRFDPGLLAGLGDALEQLPGEIARRWANWEKLAEALEANLGDKVLILRPPPGSVPWRLNLLMAGRDAAMRALHGQGLHCSSWHPPASSFLGDGAAPASVAQRVGDHILNLWVTGPDHDSYIDAVGQTLRRATAS